MEIINGTPYVIGTSQITDKNAKIHLLMVAKATYAFPYNENDLLKLTQVQQPIFDADVFEGEPGEAGVHFESDWVYLKPRCDILIKGNAYTPKAQSMKTLQIGFKVNNCQKHLLVVGDRYWEKGLLGLKLSEPEPFKDMPISYTRSYGGKCQSDDNSELNNCYADNPIGTGYAEKQNKKHLIGKRLPNIVLPDQSDVKKCYPGPPAGFGPVARTMPKRLGYAGTFDQNWVDNVFPLWPEDFDERYFQAAPEDQQTDYLQGGEQIELWNLNAEQPHIAFKLPTNLTLPAVAFVNENQPVLLTSVVDTLSIDADARTFTLTWRGRLPLKRSMREVSSLAIGKICKRWWDAIRYGADDCGCGGIETDDDDLISVVEALKS